MNFNHIKRRVELTRIKLAEEDTQALLIVVREGFNWENAYYLSGFRGSSCALVITADAEYIITDGRYLQQVKGQSPFRLVEQGQRSMEKAVGDLIGDLRLKSFGYEGVRISASFFKSIELPGIVWKDLSSLVPTLRRCKEDDEIALIKKAATIASRAFEETLSRIDSQISEAEFSNFLEYRIKKMGAERGWPGQHFVVVSGLRTSLPHGAPGEKIIKKGEWVTVDFGATFNGYISDITRNFSLGNPPEVGFEFHDIIKDAHHKAAAALAPGVRCQDIDKIARDHIEGAGYGKNFIHGLGHGLGLEIHEMPRLSASSGDVLLPGDVVTVEPGIYVDGIGGMRLEDDYLITSDGSKRLTDTLDQKIFIL